MRNKWTPALRNDSLNTDFILYSLLKPYKIVVNKFTKAKQHKDMEKRYNRENMPIKFSEGRK